MRQEAEGIFFNVNDYVWIRLTDAGKSAWQKHWSQYSVTAPELHTKNGYTRFVFWEAMQIFGPSTSIAGELLFETKAWLGQNPPMFSEAS